MFSYRNRPVHMGPYPTETLARQSCTGKPDYGDLHPMRPLDLSSGADPTSIQHAMDDYLSLLDTLRDGPVNPQTAEIPECPDERANNLKGAGYFLDATIAGTCRLSPECWLEESFSHPRIAEWFQKCQAVTKKPLPPMMEMAYGRIAMAQSADKKSIEHHSHALVYAVEYPRDPREGEPGTDWIQNLQPHRASLLSAEVAVSIANYLRLLGYEARAHTATSSDIDLRKAAIAAGICSAQGQDLHNPFIGARFGLAVVTTNLTMSTDLPLAPQGLVSRLRSKGPTWWLGTASHKNAYAHVPFARRKFKDSLFPMEKIRRQEKPTTLVDEARIPRLPKRASFFNRAFIGDLGKGPRDASIDGAVVLKHPYGAALTSMLNSYSLLQRGEENEQRAGGYKDLQANADRIKATLHFLGADLVGISAAPDWVWYSHELDGRPIKPPHEFAITTLIDQGHETMEGASGDDWLSAAQSMRAYMRASLLNGVVTLHLRNLGYAATNHTASDGDVLQPPLVLLAGLGEVSRIGDVMLNPYLGPRLKCGVITTDFPMQVDKPIDFGLQTFCANCNKCARECPSGAISVGEKVMYNGYEMWRSDPEKCTRYRMTNSGGSMCGRCMKTCPWNLEGIFKEAPYRFLATRFPSSAPLLTRIDDWFGNGEINPVKKWWWDLDGGAIGRATVPTEINQRSLSKDLEIKPEDQTLACYPADIAPSPYMEPQPLDREAGIAAFTALKSPSQYREQLAKGDLQNLAPKYHVPDGPPPVFPVMVKQKASVSADGKIDRFEFVPLGGAPLPPFEAGAHIDVMIAPQFIRQYSLCSDPDSPSSYVIGVLAEEDGTGGSLRIHQRLKQGKIVMISRPRNHFPLVEKAQRTLLLAGGIGITPLMAMAHQLYRQGSEFTLHYKASRRAGAGFIDELASVPWSAQVKCFFSDEDRLNVADILGDFQPGDELYTCGPSAFMDAVFESALTQGWDEEHLHREYFTVPDDLEYENFDFRIRLQRSRTEIAVAAEQSAADALAEAGYPIDTKCSDGLCGVCVMDYLQGDVEHRDYVLSRAQREGKLALCCSRAAKADGEIVLDL
jgi:reductive dehalogenase